MKASYKSDANQAGSGILLQQAGERYLLIKACGAGFWHDMEHVVGALLLAEMAKRTPIVYWGKNSLYGGSEVVNAFEQFFFPVSNTSVHDLMHQEYRIFPEMWNVSNLISEETHRYLRGWWHPIEVMLARTEDILVLGWAPLYMIQAYLQNTHPAHGSPENIYRYIFEKYIRLQPHIEREIDDFYNANMLHRHILAVHVRGSDKITEVEMLPRINALYHDEIKNYLRYHPDAYVFFLLTESEIIREEFTRIFGDRLISTECQRSNDNISVHYKEQADKIRTGIEVLKDVYLATCCDSFIGNLYSNVSNAIVRLKQWPEGAAKLFSLNDL